MSEEKKRAAGGKSSGPRDFNARNEGDSPASATEKKQENSVVVPDWELLKKVPTLMAYIDRVEATPKSFRHYVVEEPGGKYTKVLGSINVERDGTINCSGVDEPTEDEQKAIKAELPSAGWPTNKEASNRDLPESLRQEDPKMVFQFKSPDGQHTLFIQHRVEPPGEEKYYVPWSYWSDDQWRQMEPDGLLPLYGLDKLKDHSTVFLHEGPKAAAHCAWMVGRETKSARDAFNAHPWNKELDCAAHLGWAGGAPNPHRTDWSPLKRSAVLNLYMSADNDQPGQEAIKAISRLTLLPMTAIMYDQRFKTGFDLGDAWPQRRDFWKKLDDGTRKYIGPQFHELCTPATFATAPIPKKKNEKGPPKYKLRDEFVAEWVASSKPVLFAHRRYTHLLLNAEEFNNKVAPYSDVENVARRLAKHPYAKVEGIAYRPFRPDEDVPRIVTIDGERKINTYRPPTIKPVSGNAMPFLRYMTHLIPDKGDRKLLMRWCATLIARPEIRMTYSVLLVSAKQGVGKTTLSDAILAPLVGPWNVSYPTEKQIVDSNFNGWNEQKRLGSINEIYSGERRKAYDRLKQPVSDRTVDVERKFQEPYTIENYLHVVACSNSIQAIYLDDEDRRWLVPGVTEKRQEKAFWVKFYAWLNSGGLSIIAWWAEAFVTKHGAVEMGDNAPFTSKKQEAIAASRTENKQLAHDLAKIVTEHNEHVVLRVDKVRDWIVGRRGGNVTKMESLLTLRNVMIDAGMLRPKPKLSGKNKEYRIPIGGRPVEVLANFQIEVDAKWEDDLVKFYKDPNSFIKDEM